MKIFNSIILIPFFAAIISSCDGDHDNGSKNPERENDNLNTKSKAAALISTDTARLGKLLSFAIYHPDSVKFLYTVLGNAGAEKRITVPGPTDFDLQAVLYFDTAVFKQLMKTYRLADWKDPGYQKAEFRFTWLSRDIEKELLQSDSIPHGYVDLFWTNPNDPNCHIWMLDKKLLLHMFSR